MTADATPQMQMKSAAGTTVRSALRDAIAQLFAAGTPSHVLAAELLLMHATGRDRAWIYAHPEAELSEQSATNFFELITRRASGVPTQYLTGKQEFWALEFEVTPAVLIPRPETEHVIEVVLERLRPRAVIGQLRVADVGTGSGCIAVALAKELPSAEIVATDISAPALEVARRNAERHGVSHRVLFVVCDLLQGAARDAAGFDVVVSNPPYVARAKESELAREVREHEPRIALFGGATGTEIYDRLIAQAAQHLRAGGLLVMEISFGVAQRMREMLDDQLWNDIRVTNDLAGIPRVISAVRK
ncbi:MAG TPA: peptide chain release factor N(5)-glutamine methyltransferase [Candidatus Acidoferrales bacterium]|nr:peptide chain release factor N(5)-glutamine methyltransferase [Candidatus Acidoferrales bacterium]